MKMIKLTAKAALMAIVMACTAACSDDEGNTNVAPVFPEQTVQAVQAGTEVSVAFDANQNWTLESNRLWCKINGQTIISGEAGKQNITVSVTDEMQGIASDTANISLTLGSATQIIAKIIRTGETLQITDTNGTPYGEENPVAIAYTTNGATAKLTFGGNFNWELKESPVWLTAEEGLPIRANAGNQVTITLTVAKDSLAKVMTDTLRFYMQNTDTYVPVPVSYSGLPEGTVVTDGINGSAFWWNIAADGQSYWKEGSMVGSEVEKTPFPLHFRVIAKDNAYKILKVEQNNQWMNVMEEDYGSFVSISDDTKGNITVNNFEANSTGERIAYILALPLSVYEEAREQAAAAGGIYDGIILTEDGSDLNTNFEKYAVLACKQEAAGTSEGGFEILFQGWQPMECQQGDGGTGQAGKISSEYSVDAANIYTVNVDAGSRITINPMLSADMWNGSDFNNVIAYTFDGGSVNKDTWEAGMTQDESGFTVSITAEQPMVLVFRGTDYLNKKALIVNAQ